MLCLLCNTTQLTTIKCFQKKPKDWFENFSKTANFLTVLMKKENYQNTISAKTFVKRTGCLKPSKCLVVMWWDELAHAHPLLK